MDPMNVASSVNLAGAGGAGLGRIIVKLAHDYPVEFGIVVAILVIGVVLVWVHLRRLPDAEEPEGPPVRGTAKVLSATSITARFQPINAVKQTRKTELWEIKLEVQIPGRQPYVTVAAHPVCAAAPADIVAIQPGRIVPVQVDSINPEKVRIDFTQAPPTVSN